MRIKYLLLIFYILIGCNTLKDKTSSKLNYVVIEYDKYPQISKNAAKTKLSKKEIQKIESILIRNLKDYNKKKITEYIEFKKSNPNSKLEKDRFIIELSNYAIQYVPFINKNGEKVVWIHAFCNYDFNFTKKELKKEIIDIADGGNCLFEVFINMKNEEFNDFRINGLA